MKNWKTTLFGVLACVPTVLHLIFPQFMPEVLANTLSSVIAGAGLVAAKDGSSKPTEPEASTTPQ